MTPLQTIRWIEEVEKGMMRSQNPFINNLYKKDAIWRTSYEKAMSELSDAEIDEYNKGVVAR